MDKPVERLLTGLAERTSRRGLIGRAGRIAVALGAAASGIAKLTPALAQVGPLTHWVDCFGCDFGGSCRNGSALGCLQTGFTNSSPPCSGTVFQGCTCGGSTHNGWAWYCCKGGTKYLCADCCHDSNNLYSHTCQTAWTTC